MKLAGIDGCRGGWVRALFDNSFDSSSDGSPDTSSPLTERRKVSIDVFETFTDCCEALIDAKRILVDIPMGLPDVEERNVEGLARKLLKGRAASIFSVPSRTAVYAGSYIQACELNADRFGKRLSKQVWNICPKIREVDRYLRRNPDIRDHVFESHPELAFSRIGSPSAQDQTLASKKTPEGVSERINRLSCFLPADALLKQALTRFPRSRLLPDDVLDALVLLVAAGRQCTRIPLRPQVDEFGIEVRMLVPDRYR